MEEPIDQPLTQAQTLTLLAFLKGKERLLMALPLATGISLQDALKLTDRHIYHSAHFGNPIELEGRQIQIPIWLSDLLKPYAHGFTGPIFNKEVSESWLRKIVLQRTGEALGERRSYAAMRKTFIKNAIEQNVPFDIIVDNTGESADTIYKYLKQWQTPRAAVLL